MARIVGQAVSGIEPLLVMMAPVKAVRKLVEKIGWNLADVDLVELNEAFSVQAIAVSEQLELNPEKVNVNGGAVALGHPIGASGARILVTCLRNGSAQRQTRHCNPMSWRRQRCRACCRKVNDKSTIWCDRLRDNGQWIAHVAARAGFEGHAARLQQPFLDRALQTIEKNLDREVAKYKISADVKSAALSRMLPTTQNTALAAADFVIEAVIEDTGNKVESVRSHGCNYPSWCNTGLEYVLDIDHEDRLEDKAAR